MKCIHCGNDSTYKQRVASGKRCPSCHRAFAFEPKTDPLSVSDPLFQKCIVEVSAVGTLQFTARQLYYEFSRRVKKKTVHVPPPFGWAAAGIAVGGGIGAVFVSPILVPLAAMGAVIALTVGGKAGAKLPQGRVPVTSFTAFRTEYLDRWVQAHGEIAGLLPPPSRSRVLWTSDVASASPPDLTAYSFDRALIVDSAEVAAMLVANRFHFENNCAILSLDKRFPENGRFEQVREMLRRNPRLIVFALHNASVEGMTTTASLREPDWFPDPAVRIADIGLRPRHTDKSRILLCKGDSVTLTAETRAALDKTEAAWLEAGFTAELEALRPAKLMRAIYQTFSQMVTVGPDGGFILVDTGPGIWVGDGYGAGSGVYAADSFG